MAQDKQPKSYSIKDIAAEFEEAFPDIKDHITILDPEDHDNDPTQMMESVRHLYEEEAEKKRQKALTEGNVVMQKAVSDKERFIESYVTLRTLNLVGNLTLGSPCAAITGLDDDIEHMGGAHRIVYGGNSDLTFDDIAWRLMSTISTNALASMMPEYKDDLKERMKGKYILPDELNNAEMLRNFVLDHELGHAATAHLLPKTKALSEDVVQHWECIADSYALIRHYQRYGEDSAFGEHWSAFRSAAAVLTPDPAHWTSEAMQEVMDMNKQGLLTDLSPQEAIDLAMEIAEKHSFGLDESPNIKNAFDTSPLRDAFAETAGKAAKKKLGKLWNKVTQKEPVNDNSDEDEESFLQRVEEATLRKAVERLENTTETIDKIGNIALDTKSSAVYRVASHFLNTIDKLWPDVDKNLLSTVQRVVANRRDIPTDEPQRSIAKRAVHNLRTKKIRKKFGNG